MEVLYSDLVGTPPLGVEAADCRGPGLLETEAALGEGSVRGAGRGGRLEMEAAGVPGEDIVIIRRLEEGKHIA